VRSYLELLRRNPDFRRVFGAELVVLGGDWFAVVPLLALLPKLTGSGVWGGLALGIDTLVFAVLSPYAGAVADRSDRRRISLTASACAAIAVTVLFGVRSGSTAWLALVGIGGVAVAKAFYTPAVQAAIPNLVEAEDLVTANILMGGAWGTMAIVGASLGGIVAQLASPYACFAVDAVLLVGATWFTSRVRRSFQGERDDVAPVAARQAVAEALRYIRQRPRVLALVTVKSAVGLGNGTLTLFPLLAAAVFHVGPSGIGLFYAARGLGALLGPFSIGRLLRHRPGRLLPGLAFSMALYGSAYVVFGFIPWFIPALGFVMVAHAAGGANWSLSAYAIQAEVPDELRGRVFSLDFMVATLAVSLSQVSAGFLADHVPLRILASGFGAVTLAYAVGWSLATRRLRKQSRKPAAPSYP
jgi:MFS family permease